MGSGSAAATVRGGGGGADFVVAPLRDSAKLGEPRVLDAVMPIGTITRTEQLPPSLVAPKSRDQARCLVPAHLAMGPRPVGGALGSSIPVRAGPDHLVAVLAFHL
jgi:hypothetical protein